MTKKPKKKLEIPKFNTEEEEAKFWETHNLFDYNLKPAKKKDKAPKNCPISIRLDNESRLKLEELAASYNVGPSTFARQIIDAAISRLDQKQQKSLSIEDALRLIETLMPKDLEEKVKLFEEQNPALSDAVVSALEKNPAVSEALLKETIVSILRVGGLLKTSGFTIESDKETLDE